MVYRDRNCIIFKTFESEYRHTNKTQNYKSFITWSNFIKQKNLGIQCEQSQFLIVVLSRYIVTDKKKWVLTKLKYGF
jgi:hypothetical protein